MTLKENSKSFTYLIGVYTLPFLFAIYTIIVNVLSSIGGPGKSEPLILWAHLNNIIQSIPSVVLYLLLLKTYIKERNNVDKVLSAFTTNIILTLISSVIISVVPILVFKQSTNILRIILFLSSSSISILTLIAINVIKEQGKTTFYKVMLIVGLVSVFISRLWYWVNVWESTHIEFSRLFQIYEGVFARELLYQLFGFVLSVLSILVVYMYIKDIICTEKTHNIQNAKEENIAKNVILTIITFGVYGYIWLYRMSRNIKCLNNDKSSSTGELLCLLFVPFYMLYWVYTRAKAIKTQADCRNIQISDGATLYLILSLLGLNIVSIALMQNDLNVVLRNKEKPIIQNSVENNSQKETTDIEKITQLSELKEKGILTEEEYQKKKQEILDRI